MWSIGDMKRNGWAVSYTHLDVYKRQEETESRFCFFPDICVHHVFLKKMRSRYLRITA